MAVSVETSPSGTGRIPRRVIAQFYRIVAASHSLAEEFNEAHATRPPPNRSPVPQSHTLDNSGPRECEHPYPMCPRYTDLTADVYSWTCPRTSNWNQENANYLSSCLLSG